MTLAEVKIPNTRPRQALYDTAARDPCVRFSLALEINHTHMRFGSFTSRFCLLANAQSESEVTETSSERVHIPGTPTLGVHL